MVILKVKKSRIRTDKFSMLTSGMDDIDISVSGAEMMNSSQMMQALTMFQSFYGIFKN